MIRKTFYAKYFSNATRVDTISTRAPNHLVKKCTNGPKSLQPLPTAFCKNKNTTVENLILKHEKPIKLEGMTDIGERVRNLRRLACKACKGLPH